MNYGKNTVDFYQTIFSFKNTAYIFIFYHNVEAFSVTASCSFRDSFHILLSHDSFFRALDFVLLVYKTHNSSKTTHRSLR